MRIPGQIEQRTHDYARHGTTALFAALDAKTGKSKAKTQPRHCSIEFHKFLDTIKQNVSAEMDAHLILDSYSTHKMHLIHDWMTRRRSVYLHFTPTSSSWLNLVER